MSKAYQNYLKSGNQDAKNNLQRMVKICCTCA